MPPFEFATAARILFGEGTVRQVPAAAASLGRRALLVTGASPDRARPLTNALAATGISTIPFAVPGEPTLDLIRSAPRDCDFVIAFGGGSAIDAAKAIAAMLTNEGDLLDYLEVIGPGTPARRPAAPSSPFPLPPAPAPKSRAMPCSPARASRQSQPAQPAHAAAPRGGRSRTHLRSAAGDHRIHRPRCAHPIDRALRLRCAPTR